MQVASLFEDAVEGAIAGVIATAPMTWTMRATDAAVPWPEQDYLPPEQITETMLEKAGNGRQLVKSKQNREALATLAHYGFGGTAGAIFGVAARRAPLPTPVSGVLWGTLVWAGSYLGALPALGLRHNAADDSAGRNFQMVVAHLVWGAVAGAIVDSLNVRTDDDQ